MTEAFRYAVIGTGMMGREHIENIKHLPGAEVVAISDVNERSLAQGQQAAGLKDEACFSKDEDLLAAGGVDAYVVATPNHNHRDVMERVLRTDAHVLVEKPLATSVEACTDIVDAATHSSRVVWMGLEYRYKPAIARLIQEVENGAVGRVRMVSIREHRFPFLAKVDNWNRFRRNTGGTLVEKCCHFFDLMNLIIGAEPRQVMASGSQSVNHLDEEYEGETPDIIDNAFVIVEYENGARAMLDLCMFAEASRNEQELSVVGELGKVEGFVPESIVRVGDRATGSVVEETVSDERIAYEGLHDGSSYLEHLDFLDAIRSKRPPKVTLEDGRLAVAIGEAGHISIDEGRPVMLTEVLR